MMKYGLEKPREMASPPVRLPVKFLMVTVTGLLDLLLFEHFGRILSVHPVTNRAFWSIPRIAYGVVTTGIIAAMHRALLWKWTCQKSWKVFFFVILLAAVLPGSVGFYIGLKGLWESSR